MFYTWSLGFRVSQVILVFFPRHFMFGLAACDGCATLLKLNVVYRHLLIYPRFLEFCRPFLFSTGYFSFNGSTARRCPRIFADHSCSFPGSVCYGVSRAPKNSGPAPNSPPCPAQPPGAPCDFWRFPAPAPGPSRSPDGSQLKQVGRNRAQCRK